MSDDAVWHIIAEAVNEYVPQIAFQSTQGSALNVITSSHAKNAPADEMRNNNE